MKGSITLVLVLMLAVNKIRSHELGHYHLEGFENHDLYRRHLTPLGNILHNAASKLLNPFQKKQTGSEAESHSFSIGGSILGIGGSISASRSKASSAGGAGGASASSSAQSSGLTGNGFSNSNAESSAQAGSYKANYIDATNAQSSGASNTYGWGQQGFSNSQSSSQASSKFEGGQLVQQQPVGYIQPTGSQLQGFGGGTVGGNLGGNKVIGYEITPIVVPVQSLPTVGGSNSFSNSQASSASQSVGTGPGISGLIAVPLNHPGLVGVQPVLGQQDYYGTTNTLHKQTPFGTTGGIGYTNTPPHGGSFNQNNKGFLNQGGIGTGFSNSQSQSSSLTNSGGAGIGGNLNSGFKTTDTLLNSGGLGGSQGVGGAGYNTQTTVGNSASLGSGGNGIPGSLGSGGSSSQGSLGGGLDSDSVLDSAIEDVFGIRNKEGGSESNSQSSSSSQNYSGGLLGTGSQSSSHSSSNAKGHGNQSSSKSQSYSNASSRSNSEYLIFT